MTAIVTELIGILTSGFTSFASGIGTGLNAFATNIFISGSGTSQTLSTFGGLVAVFAAISLTIGISKLVVRWLTSLGGSRM